METRYLYSALLAMGAVVLALLWRKIKPDGQQTQSLPDLTHDLTAEAHGKELDPVIGRNEEISRVIHILSRRNKNNPLLVGPPGVGKTAIVEGLARKMVAGDVPEKLANKKILALNLGDLISGTAMRGQLEQRFQAIVAKFEENPGSTILFIDEVHMLSQATGTEGGLDLADMIKPPMARGDVSVIGATTMDEYGKSIKRDSALDRRFQPVFVGEPTIEESIEILQGLRELYENYHNVKISDDAIDAAVKLAEKHIEERYLPDKALDVLDEACAAVAIESKTKEGDEKPQLKVSDIEDVTSSWEHEDNN